MVRVRTMLESPKVLVFSDATGFRIDSPGLLAVLRGSDSLCVFASGSWAFATTGEAAAGGPDMTAVMAGDA